MAPFLLALSFLPFCIVQSHIGRGLQMPWSSEPVKFEYYLQLWKSSMTWLLWCLLNNGYAGPTDLGQVKGWEVSRWMGCRKGCYFGRFADVFLIAMSYPLWGNPKGLRSINQGGLLQPRSITGQFFCFVSLNSTVRLAFIRWGQCCSREPVSLAGSWGLEFPSSPMICSWVLPWGPTDHIQTS